MAGHEGHPRAVDFVRGQGVTLTDEAMSRVAPIRWDHIVLPDDDVWSGQEAPRERFRPLRTARFRPEAYRPPGVHGCRDLPRISQ